MILIMSVGVIQFQFLYLHVLRDGASLAATAAELAEVAVAPGVDEALVGERQRLRVAAPARNLHHALPAQRLHLWWVRRFAN